MQIFRVSESHIESAKYLDNRRLSKQVLELYQIIRVCLSELNIIDGNTRYLSHPIVKHVFNDGDPYVIDCFDMLSIMNEEHIRRGGKRSVAFKEDIQSLRQVIEANQHLFNGNPLPPFYVYGDEKIYGEVAYDCYKVLLNEKWRNDKIAPRCGVKIRKGDQE